MAAHHVSQFLSHFLLFIFISILSLARSQVPANQTFKFVNEGEFGDRIIEYDASYRVIRTDTYTFYTFPFRLCFYNTTPNAFVFAIRAGIPNDESLMRWVWDANRHDPVVENATLSFGRDGNLVLSNPDGRIVWQTNTANKGVTGIKMLGNGNLVLHDKKDKLVWQSFDYPTDALLVGQSVRINGVNKLVSRKSDIDGSDGPHSLVLDRTGFTMYLNYSNKLLTYGGWPGTDYGSTITFDAVPENDNATAYELVLTINQDAVSSSQNGTRRRLFQVRPIGNGQQINLNKINYNGSRSFLRLGSDGNLRVFTYYDKVGYLKWEETFAFFSSYFVRECALPSKCGNYGLCTKGMCVACPSQKGLLGWSESCEPPKVAGCGSGGRGKAVRYYKIVGVEHFLNPYLDDGEGPMKVGECRAKCDKDCKCVGFIYKEDKSKCLRAPLLGTLIRDANTSVGYIKY